MWGGRFNPIVIVDRPEAIDLVELFRVDMIVPVGDSPEVKAFCERFPHLISPFFPDSLFLTDEPARTHVLDIHNALTFWQDMPEWKALNEEGIRVFSWDGDDPLADVFNIQYGAYPDANEIGIDYADLLSKAMLPTPLVNTKLNKGEAISPEVLQFQSIAFLSRNGLRRHYTVRPGWDYLGVYVGDASNLVDLTAFWNLRAADISLQFFDPQHLDRYQHIRPEIERRMREALAHLDEHRRKLAVWADRTRLESALLLFPDGNLTACGIDEWSWKGGAMRGGAGGARAFKIPGVRRLIKTYGLRASFTRDTALQLIGGRDPKNPAANFADHGNLFIEPRAWRTKLTPDMVFSHLVEKNLFRIGAELTCPVCKLPSWIALDQLQQRNICELCGAEYDGTRQLVGSEFHYRRTGVLGIEKNAQGAVPVTLLLQQLSVNTQGLMHDGIYLPSFDLAPKDGVDLPSCETDFIVILHRTYPHLPQLIIGECKDKGGTIDTKDVENMRRIADAFPKRRFETFILFAKLSPFTQEEISRVKTLNGQYEQRVMLLTDRELEPYHLYERTEKELGIKTHGGSPGQVARTTSEIYFQDKPGF
jgi:hypothetical protein